MTSSDARELRVYASVANGQTLYHQGAPLAGALRLTYIIDDSERLATAMLGELPHCDTLDSHKGMVVGTIGNALLHSEPLWPHLMDPARGFVLLPAQTVGCMDCGEGVYVGTAEKVYFVRALGTDAVRLDTASDVAAVAGSFVKLPDGRAAWFTRHGQAVGNGNGQVELVNRATYAPTLTARGAAGVLDHNGNQTVVTTLRGAHQPNTLQAGDYWDLEVT